MAKVDRNKLLTQAQKFVQEGNLAKAIESYELLYKAFPDVNTALRLAGLYQRVGKNNEAVKVFARVGEEYTRGGFYQKAVAAYKQALGITPNSPELHEKIGDLFRRMQIKSSAIEHLYQAARLYAQNSDHAHASEILKQLVELEPDRVDLKALYADSLFQMGKTEEALHIFRGLIELLKLENKFDEVARFYERILKYNPDDTQIAKDLARVYIRLSLPQKGMRVLKDLFDRGLVDAELFELLGIIYVLIGKNDRAVHAFLEMIKHLDPTRDKSTIEKTYKRILEIDPTNEEALRALSRHEPPQLFVPAATTEEGGGEVVEVMDLPEERPIVSSKAALRPPAPETLKKDEFFNLLQEASVFLRFGVQDKALATLNRILSKNPDHIIALKKRAEILRKHDPSQAVRDLVHLAQLHEALGQAQEAQKFIEEAKAINPNHPAIKAHLGLVDFDLEAELAADLAPEKAGEVGGPVTAEEEGIELELEEAGEEEPESITVIRPSLHAHEETESDPFAKTLAEISEEVGAFLDAQKSELETPPPGQSSDLLIGGTGLDTELEQVQFFMDTGLYDEARRLLEDLRNRFGDHPKVLKIAADLLSKTQKKTGKPAVSSPPPPGEFNLESLVKELEGELGFLGEVSPGSEDAPPLEEIIARFKEGVKRQLGEDPHAHYDLGIAYMEMGLLDDAIQEFELCGYSPEKFVESREMLAEAYRRKGDIPRAARALEEALRFPNLADTAYLNIHYNLALFYEDLGDLKKALEHFRMVLEKDKGFRDTVEQLKRMKDKIQVLRAQKSPTS